MASLKERIIGLLNEHDGYTDREITNLLLGENEPQQSVNQACRSLEASGNIKRVKRENSKIGNYLGDTKVETRDHTINNNVPVNKDEGSNDRLAEDRIKQFLDEELQKHGWKTQIAWGKKPGIDIDAYRNKERWIIEVKGQGKYQPMNVNYFIGILGETLQRMGDPNAKYSIALPDIKQFRNLWERLPLLAKQRTGITALFIDSKGNICEE